MLVSTRHIAIFGDTHGHIRLMLLLCRLWQENNNSKLDAILQCGDIGFFPDPERMDRATKKFAKRDPEELGFWRYFAKPSPQEEDPRSRNILCDPSDKIETVSCPIIMCHGNHEDFESLNECLGDEDLTPIDYYNRLLFLKSGKIANVAGIRVAAVGGAPEKPDEQNAPSLGPRVSASACNELKDQQIDVLITHGGPIGIGGETNEWGSRHLRSLINATQPCYHFFAHHGEKIERTSIGRTCCVWHNDTSFTRNSQNEPTGIVHPGAMSVLHWKDKDNHTLETIAAPWYNSITGTTWLYF
jgi:Icc-related predicted phosphoesterase